jgi:Tol biopolymer transport system component
LVVERVEQLTSGSCDTCGDYSPDGTQIAFDRGWTYTGGGPGGSIYRMASDGRNPIALRISPGGRDYGEPTWRPDGQRIVYDDEIALGPYDLICIRPTDGAQAHTITPIPGDGRFPNFSPDGTKVVYATGNGTIHVADYKSTETPIHTCQLLNDMAITAPGAPGVPSWRPDGGKIVYAFGTPNYHICVMDPDGSNSQQLSFGAFDDIMPAFSPDGQFIAFLSNRPPSLGWDAWAMRSDGTGVIQLASIPGDGGVTKMDWHPDGRRVIFLDGFNAQFSLYVAHVHAAFVGPPMIESAILSDRLGDGGNAGDQLILTLSRSVTATTSVLQASHFFLPVPGDSLGSLGFRVEVNPHNGRQLMLQLGQGASLRAFGQFSTATITPGAPSGIDFSPLLPPGSIQSLDGIPAIDGGRPGIDDSGVDIQISFLPGAAILGVAGGVLSVPPAPDAAYTNHRLIVPPSALAADTQFRMMAPDDTHGVISAVQLESGNPGLVFALPATIRLEYREGDVDVERGYLDFEMRVHRLVEAAPGVVAFRPIRGARIVDRTNRLVSVGVDRLEALTQFGPGLPAGGFIKAQGTPELYAGIPLETVDDHVINIKPGSGGSPARQSVAVLTPGPYGAYTLPRIEFPGYVETTTTDSARLVATIRSAWAVERNSTDGGQSFPSESGAVFVVTILDALDQPVAFTDPVNLRVQFKERPDASQTDVVYFNEQPARAEQMRIVWDDVAGQNVNFDWRAVSPQDVDTTSDTVSATQLTGLTGTDGKGTWGTVGRAPVPSLRTRTWRRYR